MKRKSMRREGGRGGGGGGETIGHVSRPKIEKVRHKIREDRRIRGGERCWNNNGKNMY